MCHHPTEGSIVARIHQLRKTVTYDEMDDPITLPKGRRYSIKDASQLINVALSYLLNPVN